ncbi:type I polyketide synthase, partial [Frankia sp. CNm7]|uniref:type I polyketide synthase n=1 Tax=Frankia nepalensis TaxID=1836974 RepID=UPI001932401B
MGSEKNRATAPAVGADTSPGSNRGTGISGAREPIAVVGLSCRLPQAASPAEFWRLLRDGVDAVTDAPADRWDLELLAELGLSEYGRGGFLDAVDRFDAGFFGISPREAAAMDPQQRLVLELAWEVLEDAGVVPETLRGSRTGVFVGAVGSEYASLTGRYGPAAIDRHTMTGQARGLIANRVSYLLGLRGPSLVVDAAQSSGLVAVHLACESLWRGETTLAIAGGVNLNLLADTSVAAARFGALSPDGRAYTFDARANGYVRGEGGATVLLMPLSRAIAEGWRGYGVILGGAVNNDGGGAGLAVPDGAAQAAVLRAAYADAGVDPAEVRYVELHGTGTKVGDPVEARALGAVLGAGRSEDRRLRVGSAKTNVGHLEGAAGIVGLLKVLLALRHRQLPATLHHAEPNPAIGLADLGLAVQDRLGPWPAGGGRGDGDDGDGDGDGDTLVAGVSSFGMGGTNCHLVVAGAPGIPAPPPPNHETPAGGRRARTRPVTGTARPAVLPWVLSARGETALKAMATRLLAHLDADKTEADETEAPGSGTRVAAGSAARAPRPGDVAWALATTRATFEHRAVVLGWTEAELRAGLGALAAGLPAAGLHEGRAARASRVVLVFPGQGSQWVGMASALLERSPVFAAAVDDCARALAPHLDWSLHDVLGNAPGAVSLDRVDVVQPALFAVMVSLARLWESLGVRPDAVIGHSQGEIAAAHVAGALTLDDAARIVALRSRALVALAGGGAMAQLALPADEVRAHPLADPARVSVAAVNGPASTVISGDPATVAALVAEHDQRGVRARLIPVDYASHSPQVEAVGAELRAALAGIRPTSSRVTFYSTVTGGSLDTAGLDADYWYRNLRQTVLLQPATEAALADGHRLFVEVSPHPVLTGSLQETFAETEPAAEPASLGERAAAIGTLRRDEGGWERLLSSAAQAFARGAPVDWAAALRGQPAVGAVHPVPLPTFPFQRERHWLTGAYRAPAAALGHATAPADTTAPDDGPSSGGPPATGAGGAGRGARPGRPG